MPIGNPDRATREVLFRAGHGNEGKADRSGVSASSTTVDVNLGDGNFLGAAEF